MLIGFLLTSNIPLLFKKSDELVNSEKPNNGILAAIGLAAGFVSGLTGAVVCCSINSICVAA
ncbi:hypothetical protein CH375_09675 [Leptospira ellisii]|nr:hypothetical protein CH375_09675 [Leptospira ellisii]